MRGYKKCIFLIIVAMSLVACEEENVTNANMEIDKGMKRLENINNRPMSNEDKEVYYYTNNYKLVREDKLNGTREVILDEPCKNINVLEDRIIVMGESQLYSICKQTNKKQVLLQSKCSDVQVVNDWIYFINESENRYIYRMTLEGTQVEQLNDKSSGRLVVLGENCIIYCAVNEEEELFDNFYTPCGKLYKLDINQGQSECLTTYNVSFINVVDDWIYFANVDDEMHLYKIKLDGSQEQIIIQDHAYYIKVTSDTIYYSDVSRSIYSTDLEGKNNEKLEVLDARYMDLNKVGDRLYYVADGIEPTGYIDLISNKQIIFNKEDENLATNEDISSNVSIDNFLGK